MILQCGNVHFFIKPGSDCGRLMVMMQVAGWGLPKSVLFEERDMTTDAETHSKNIDYDFTKKK